MGYKAYGGSIILVPFNHFQSRSGLSDHPEGTMDLGAEKLRWMDHVLKGIDNGMDKEPPVVYYTFNAKEGQHWRYADTWPLDTVRPATLYFDGEKSGTVASRNDGTLTLIKPEEEAADSYKVDSSISVFDNHDSKGFNYIRMNMQWNGDMLEDVDIKGLTFTSKPFFFVYDNEITGHVGVNLWVTSNASDGDFDRNYDFVLFEIPVCQKSAGDCLQIINEFLFCFIVLDIFLPIGHDGDYFLSKQFDHILSKGNLTDRRNTLYIPSTQKADCYIMVDKLDQTGNLGENGNAVHLKAFLCHLSCNVVQKYLVSLPEYGRVGL